MDVSFRKARSSVRLLAPTRAVTSPSVCAGSSNNAAAVSAARGSRGAGSCSPTAGTTRSRSSNTVTSAASTPRSRSSGQTCTMCSNNSRTNGSTSNATVVSGSVRNDDARYSVRTATRPRVRTVAASPSGTHRARWAGTTQEPALVATVITPDAA